MGRLIDADEFLEILDEVESDPHHYDKIQTIIELMPAATKLCGHWIISCDGYYPYCSNCKEEPKGGMSKFCPNCGAEMSEKSNEL